MNSIWLDWLKQLMREKKVNNKGLAALLLISPSTVGAWKKGAYKPDAISIVKLADLSESGITAGELFAMIYERPLPNDRPPRTMEQMAEEMPLDQLARLVMMKLEKRAEQERAGDHG